MTQQHEFANLVRSRQHTQACRLPFLMWRDTIAGPERQATNFHRDFCSLYVVRRGRGAHVIDGVSYGVARGDVYAMGPGMSHYFVNCDSLVTDTFHFQPSLFDHETRRSLAALPGFPALFVTDHAPTETDAPGRQRWLHLTPTQLADIQAAIAELQGEWSAGASEISGLLTRGLFLRLLVWLSRFQAEGIALVPTTTAGPLPAGFAGPHEETIAASVRFMEERFSQRLRIEQIAAQVFLSPDRFTTVFATVMGRTPRDYLHHLRIEHAKVLLTTTELPIGRIAESAGFGEPAYFTRVLRAATGHSPTEYRREFGVK